MKRITKQQLCDNAVKHLLSCYRSSGFYYENYEDCRRIFHYFDSCGPNAPWQELQPFFEKHDLQRWLKLMCSACGQDVDEAVNLEVLNYEEDCEVYICQSCLAAALQTLGTAQQ